MTSIPAGSTALTRQIPLRRIKSCLASLAGASLRQGVKPEAVAAFISESLSVCCIECGLSLKREELTVLAGADSSASNSPRLERVALGYCARNNCPSSYYQITSPNLDASRWNDLWAAVDSTLSPGLAETAEHSTPSVLGTVIGKYDRSKIMIAGASFAAALFLIYWHLRTPSWSSKPSPYKPAVSSAGALTGPQPGAVRK
jgi:hypothetical protein